MASCKVNMPEDFLLKLSRLEDQTDRIIEKMLEAGGGVVLAKMKSNLGAAIGKNLKIKGRSTGELIGALGVSPVKMDRNGTMNVKVGFNEPRKKQNQAKGKRSYYVATNAMIANIIEYGKHGQPARPFLKPARSSSLKQCIEAMKAVFDGEVGKL